MEKNTPIKSELNNFTVGEFMDMFTEKAQDNMSILGYYVRDGHIWRD